MSVSLYNRPSDDVSRASPSSPWSSARPAARAFTLVSRAGLLLGLLGLAAFVPVLVRLLESWRVSSVAMSHRLSILGQRLSYPAANTGAMMILALALLGGMVTALALFSIAQELRTARRLGRRLADLHPIARGGVFVIQSPRVEAFCAGLVRPRIYLTTGAFARLDEQSLNAVLAHERQHARRRDPLRLAAIRVIARSLFFLPWLQELRRKQQMLAEVSADESAVAAAAGDRSPLARALLSFGDASEADASSGVDAARVDYLLGETPSCEVPALICVTALGLLAILVAVTILVGREAAGSATLDPPFLSAQPCIVMLAMIPCALGLIAARFGRILTSRATSSAHTGSPA